MAKFRDFMRKWRKNRAEKRKLHAEIRREHDEFHKRVRELRGKHTDEFHHYHRHIRYVRPLIVIFNLLIWYLLFRYAGVKIFSVFFAVVVSMGGIYEFIFLRRIENRILNPINELKSGVKEIANGNYAVKIESDVRNEIGVLIDSFNEMAQKLHESEKVKVEYEDNRKTLIANISHDLKTPITSIQGYIEAITEGDKLPKENINKYLKIIHYNTVYINKLIDDLFLFSKLDMQKLKFEFVKVSVRPFISDLIEEFKIELEDKKIELTYFDYTTQDCSFNIDRKRLHQVFKNLIGNAVKYGPVQDLIIKVELYHQDDFVCVNIKDNGPGISADKLPYIFNRFYRIDHERTKDFMSTGLGLAIAKELVEAHGGRITVSSVLNEGTCFTVMLPSSNETPLD